MSDLPWWATVLLSSAAAVLSGWMGVVWAGMRQRRASAFERRMKWHEDAVMAAKRHSRALFAVAGAERSGSDARVLHEFWLELDPRVKEFFEILPLSFLYASTELHERLRHVAVRGAELSARIGTGDQRLTPDQLEAVEELQRLSQQTALTIADDFRRHVGMEPIAAGL